MGGATPTPRATSPLSPLPSGKRVRVRGEVRPELAPADNTKAQQPTQSGAVKPIRNASARA